MPYASNANEACMNTVDVFSIVHFVNHFFAKTINSSIRPSVKCWSKRPPSVNHAINWVNTHVCVAKCATAMITYDERDSSTRRMHRFHAQSATTKRRKRRSCPCRHVHTNLVVKLVPMIITTITMMIIKTETSHNLSEPEYNFLLLLI